MRIKDQKTFKLKEVILIILITSLIVSFSTGIILVRRLNKNTIGSKTDNKYISTFVDAYNTLLSNYYKNINEKDLMDAVIAEMYNYVGDPYTTYLNEQETENLMASLKGEYEGIGVKVSNIDTTKGIQIVEVFDDSPASKAGIIANDLITEVNGINVVGSSADEVVSIIKSSSKVEIKVLRDKEEKIFNLSLSAVELSSIESKLYEEKDSKIGYIYIGTFAVNTFEQFNKALKKLEEQNIDSLIIDVRTNTGGYLTTTTDIIELFLEKDKVIYGLKNKNVEEFYKDETEEKREYPIVVLTNEISASASEVLAGALKQSYGAILVGKKTYGKGKIQQTTSLDDGGMLKYTTADWLIPDGSCIDTIGLSPDYEVEYKKDDDKQLEKALEVLAK